MKKMNLLVMSLVSAAALSFTSCSSNDDLAGNAGQEKVNGFYMTLTVQSPNANANGTRTSVLNTTENATAGEAAINNGTLYLVDDNNNIAFHEDLSMLDWSGDVKDDASKKKDGSKTYEIKVPAVEAGKTYHVYFLAGSNKPAGDMNFNATNNNIFTATTSFASPFADDNNFAMFNQNDADVNGNGYTVTFIKANNNKKNPAKVNYSKDGSAPTTNAPIKVERVVARIDAPNPGTSTVLADAPASASEALKVAMKDAKEKVSNIELTNYAISNLANKSYVMQTWNSSALSIPNGISYIQPTASFGGVYDYQDGGFTTTEATKVNYVFENNSTTAPTTMYFEYQITLDDSKFTGPADFTDGTFYRFNNVIYTSFDQIFKDYNNVADLFGEGKTAATMKSDLTNAINNETELAKFRKDNKIEVFKGGKTDYKHVIKDNYINGIIQRNSIYRLNINNIYNVGAQVPNGEPTENDYYYNNLTVTVNPLVLNTEDVDLQ